jgi:hypothetical protein
MAITASRFICNAASNPDTGKRPGKRYISNMATFTYNSRVILWFEISSAMVVYAIRRATIIVG